MSDVLGLLLAGIGLVLSAFWVGLNTPPWAYRRVKMLVLPGYTLIAASIFIFIITSFWRIWHA